MAYYDLFVAQWDTLPAGTTQQKLDNINSQTVTQTLSPCILSTGAIYNAIVPSEYMALTTTQQQSVNLILGLGSVDVSAGTNARSVLASVFGAQSTSRANLLALTQRTAPWWQANNYPGPFNIHDTQNAGVS